MGGDQRAVDLTDRAQLLTLGDQLNNQVGEKMYLLPADPNYSLNDIVIKIPEFRKTFSYLLEGRQIEVFTDSNEHDVSGILVATLKKAENGGAAITLHDMSQYATKQLESMILNYLSNPNESV